MLRASNPNRTQISVSNDLKKMIMAHAARLGESFSEYLRKAALLRMEEEKKQKKALKELAERVWGNVSEETSGWKGIDPVKWQHEMRKEEDEHIFSKSR